MENFTFNEVTDAIGSEIYAFVHPKDLFNLSLASRCSYNRICESLIQVALCQLPPVLDNHEQIDHQVKVVKEHTFSSREHVLSHVLQKIEAAELKFPGQTLNESLINARDILNREMKPGVHGATLMSETSVRFPDPEITHVAYNYQGGNRALGTARCRYILERISSVDNESIVKCWMDYLLAQRYLVIGSWFWTCRHRQLDFQGVEGKGVMFSNPETGERLELNCSIMTTRRLSEEEEEDDQIIPQFPVATRVADGAAVNPFLACSAIQAEVVIDEIDVYAVPNPFIVSPQEQAETDPVAAVVIQDEAQPAPRSLLGLIKSKSAMFNRTRRR